MHRYEDEEQLKKYLEYCRKKAFQMKKVSDRLFEYFLVYGREEKGLQLQKIPSVELAEDLCNGQFFDWQDHGGTIECQIKIRCTRCGSRLRSSRICCISRSRTIFVTGKTILRVRRLV